MTDAAAAPRPLRYVTYESEAQLQSITALIEKDLSEPYSVFTYRYFLNRWPKLCILAYDGDTLVGVIICKLERHKKGLNRGYIAMLAVDAAYRKRSIGSTLVIDAIKTMKEQGCDEVVLETEVANSAALALYLRLGFTKDKRLQRYYLNGGDAFRLKLWLRYPAPAGVAVP